MRTTATLIGLVALLVVLHAAAGPASPAGESNSSAPTLVPAAAGGGLELARSNVQVAVQNLMQIYSPQELAEGVYLGSELCLACHGNVASWRDTGHAHFLRRPLVQNSLVPGRGALADYDGNGVDDFIQGLDFNQINSVFNPYKPNAPILSVENGQYYITVGGLKCPVVFIQAADRYVVKIPVSDSPTGLTDTNFFSPVAYTPGVGYSVNSPQNWWTESGQPRWAPGVSTAQLAGHSGNYSQSCVGCHSTGIRNLQQGAGGVWQFDGYVAALFQAGDPTVFDYDGDGNFDLMNIGCESCHGAGSFHVLGGGDPRQIVNPAKLGTQAANDICGRCHTQPHSVPSGTFGWPFDDSTLTDWTPRSAKDGVLLSDFFTDASQYWPDGKHTKVSRPYHDYYNSPKPTFRFNMVRCTDCHDPHRRGQEAQIRTALVEDGVTIPTEVENNTLCLACHATHGPFEEITPEMVANLEAHELEIGEIVSAHSNHPYAPERAMGLSRCVECHMPLTVGRGMLTGRSHTFEAIPPGKTLAFQDQGGMPNSCAQSCHGGLVNSFGLRLDPNTNNAVWGEAFDRNLARALENWFGPGGRWWDTNHE